MPLIYKKELEIKETTETVSSASFLNIYLNLDTNDQLSTRLNELDITTRRCRRLRDRMVVEFTTIYASVYTTTKVVSSNPAQARYTRYNII